MKVGFIGYGNMGSVIVKGLLTFHAIASEQIIISTRSKEKLTELVNEYPGIDVAGDNKDVAKRSEILFICVHSEDVRTVLDEIIDELRPETHLVAINGGVQIKNLEKMFKGGISKMIPSLTMNVGRGVTLMCHNSKVPTKDKAFLEEMFNSVGIVRVIAEDQFEVAADLTSCSPAFIAAFIVLFAEAGARNGKIDRKEAAMMALETLYGAAKLMDERRIGPASLMDKVATKGGITEQGLEVLKREMPAVFDELFMATSNRREEVKKRISRQYDG